MIYKETFADYVKQYRKLNPNATDFDIANHMFNYGYWYGRQRKKIDKWDIQKDDMYYKHNPTKSK